MMRTMMCTMMCMAMGGQPTLAAAQDAVTTSWNFKVYLDDKPIGVQRFEHTVQGKRSDINIDANFDVKYFYISFYTYVHRNREIWENGCLIAMESSTDDNGDTQFVRAEKQDDSLLVLSRNNEQRLPGCIQSFAYWDANFLNSSHLLNSQTGDWVAVDIQKIGPAVIEVSGQATDAVEYHVSAPDFNIRLWYSPDLSQWLALRSTTAEGKVLDYKKI